MKPARRRRESRRSCTRTEGFTNTGDDPARCRSRSTTGSEGGYWTDQGPHDARRGAARGCADAPRRRGEPEPDERLFDAARRRTDTSPRATIHWMLPSGQAAAGCAPQRPERVTHVGGHRRASRAAAIGLGLVTFGDGDRGRRGRLHPGGHAPCSARRRPATTSYEKGRARDAQGRRARSCSTSPRSSRRSPGWRRRALAAVLVDVAQAAAAAGEVAEATDAMQSPNALVHPRCGWSAARLRRGDARGDDRGAREAGRPHPGQRRHLPTSSASGRSPCCSRSSRSPAA